jgi:hypothetical protein
MIDMNSWMDVDIYDMAINIRFLYFMYGVCALFACCSFRLLPLRHVRSTGRDNCIFLPAGDISTFERSSHTILHAECSLRHFQRRNKPDRSQNAIFRRFWRKLIVCCFPLETFRHLNHCFTQFYTPNAAHSAFSFESSPAARKTRSFVDFDE